MSALGVIPGRSGSGKLGKLFRSPRRTPSSPTRWPGACGNWSSIPCSLLSHFGADRRSVV